MTTTTTEAESGLDHEIRRGREVLEVLRWDGGAWSYADEAAEARREALRQRAIARAFELGGLAYEVRNPRWRESDHREFACRETSDGGHVLVTTPLGVFRLAARRTRAGDTKTAVATGGGMVGFGATATADQTSLPVALHGRLNAPAWPGERWWFQPAYFVYEDGTSSDFLGSYPREVEWVEGEPSWPL